MIITRIAFDISLVLVGTIARVIIRRIKTIRARSNLPPLESRHASVKAKTDNTTFIIGDLESLSYSRGETRESVEGEHWNVTRGVSLIRRIIS